ncbi:WxL domain-containing protein, partial [Enterococcus mundtii]
NDADQEPTIHASGLELIPNEDAVPIMTAANRKGGGTSSVVWGDHDTLAKQVEDGVDVVENKAIQLFVPGSTAKDAVTYTSTLTWELELTPDNEAPEEV